jgi:hypothetical protein
VELVSIDTGKTEDRRAAKPNNKPRPIHKRKRRGDFEQKLTAKEIPAGTLFLVMASEPRPHVDRKMMLSINGNLRTA